MSWRESKTPCHMQIKSTTWDLRQEMKPTVRKLISAKTWKHTFKLSLSVLPQVLFWMCLLNDKCLTLSFGVLLVQLLFLAESCSVANLYTYDLSVLCITNGNLVRAEETTTNNVNIFCQIVIQALKNIPIQYKNTCHGGTFLFANCWSGLTQPSWGSWL